MTKITDPKLLAAVEAYNKAGADYDRTLAAFNAALLDPQVDNATCEALQGAFAKASDALTLAEQQIYDLTPEGFVVDVLEGTLYRDDESEGAEESDPEVDPRQTTFGF